MNEDFVTIEIAKKLHENGFNEPCINAINPYGCTYLNGWCEYLDNRDGEHITQKDLKEGCYLLPTISQVLKWLREEKKIHIQILFTSPPNKWEYITVKMTNNELRGMYATFTSYEQAALAGIEYVLDNLILL
jgi:hypothetical protein